MLMDKATAVYGIINEKVICELSLRRESPGHLWFAVTSAAELLAKGGKKDPALVSSLLDAIWVWAGVDQSLFLSYSPVAGLTVL